MLSFQAVGKAIGAPLRMPSHARAGCPLDEKTHRESTSLWDATETQMLCKCIRASADSVQAARPRKCPSFVITLRIKPAQTLQGVVGP